MRRPSRFTSKTPSRLNPGSRFLRFCRVRTKRPAPITSSNESATCVLTSDESSRDRELLIPAFSLSTGDGPAAVACKAGASPNKMPVAIATVLVNPITCQFGVKSKITCIDPLERIATRKRLETQASPIPNIAPIKDSSTLSVRSWRRMRPRPAPMARRTAISLCRVVARASSKFATLAQAINNTKVTTAISTTSGFQNTSRRYV